MAELKLGVSFDLVYFRQQLQKLGRIAASEFTAPIKIKLDRRVIDQELNNLRRVIGRRKYNVELNIAGNLSKKSFDELQQRLDTLSKRQKIEIPLSVKDGTSKKDIDNALSAIRGRIAQNQDLRQGSGKLRIGTSIKAAIANNDIQEVKKAAQAKLDQLAALLIESKVKTPGVTDLLKALQKNLSRRDPLSVKARVKPAKPAITKADIAAFKKEVEEKLSGISIDIKANVSIPERKKTAQQIQQEVLAGMQRIQQMGAERMSAGGVTEAARREQLRTSLMQSGVGITKAKDIAKQLGVRGYDKFRKDTLQELIDKMAAEASIEAITKYLDPQAVMRNPDRNGLNRVLDTFARAFFAAFGMDPAEIRRQMREQYRASLPQIDFPSTVPSRSVSVGPSGTGRALPPGITPNALPGTAFGARGFLPPQIGQDLNRILRNAAFAFVDSLNSRIRQVNVREIGRQALPPAAIRGLLPAAVGREPSIYGGPRDRQSFFQRRIAEAYQRSAARGADIMGVGGGNLLGAGGSGPAGPFRPFARPQRGGAIVPYQAPSQFGPASQLPPGYFAAGKLAAGVRGLGQDFNKAKLPLAGAVAELGDEFATATKQVLLYGTAYKALAFFTNLPMQALDVATAMQTFRNQLEAVTGSAANADRSFAFVDDLASRFNVPLQSVRDGFTKLYASMAPAGFSSAEIEGLFEGISKAAATFGMSADKVDRVNYAFAQMASKGQIMSEELRGQLGDVLPGSLALFARAAQMSIPEFTKAMEDGSFKGEAMGQVLRNVAKIMNSDFAGGAAGAANTLQGALNGLGNSVQRMYEAFEPLVGQIATALFPAVQEAIDNATLAVKAFAAAASGNSGPANMLEGNARAIYEAMIQVREIFTAVGNVLSNLAPTFLMLGQSVLSVSSALAAVVNNPIGNFLANVAAQAAIAMAAFQLLAKTGIAEAVAWMLKLIFNTKAATTQLWALVKASTAAKFGLIALGSAVVIAAITTLVGALNSVYQKMLDIQVGARNAAQAIAAMSQTEATVKARSIEGQIALLQKFYDQSKQFGGLPVEAGAAEVTAMAAAGGTPGQAFTGPLVNEKTGAYGRGTITPAMVPAAIQALQSQLAAARKQAEPAQATPLALEQVDLAAAEGRTKKEKELKDFAEDKVARLRQQLELQKNLIDVQVDLSKSQKELLKAELEYEIGLDIVEAQYQEAIKTLGEYKEGQRGSAQASMQNAAVLARENVALEYRKALLGDLAGVTNEYENKIFDLNNDTKALRASQDELTASEVLEQKIRFKTVGYTKEQLALIEPFLNKLRKEASMIDALTRSYEFLVQAREKQEALRKLRNEAAQFRAPLGQERLVELMQMPGYTQEEARRRFLLEEQNRRLQVFKQGANDLAGSINSSIGDALTNIATDFENLRQHGLNFIQTLANAFKQLANTIIQEMTRAMINRAVSQLFGFLMPASFGGGAQIGQQVNMPSGVGIGAGGGILQNAGGQGFGTLGPNFGIRQFATGGMVTGPTLGLIGEGRFNEAVVPLPNGKSIPVDLGGAAGSNISTNIVVNMNNGQASSQMTGNGGQALGRELEGAVRSVLLKESRPGGIIYSQR